ncbi:monovalent cation:proton antiporter-2 (CPA2) family protein [Defluviimonas sp. WL0050]|uniref:Monovalent cation:proton antiporter-2 (CPA2) family protein n=1 Tax=Albidovulum litorale TaxID=2984134 RepID=A0ABT2ZK86_9RHOB|nr:monovalent cation:proton antiporter-2 (CPA2) family protein [Defluviimonas sp. WL0050]MCV2871544.1 monovalent cation:proton antiporter-2 (CPA2) family protein [Defluviimonas sp. WL0050]
MESFLFQASLYLIAVVLAVPVASRLGLGSVLGYLVAGIVIGPVFGFVGSETKDLQHFAEFGVVMMLFLIGLELEPRALWSMRDRLLGLGGLQIVVTALVVTLGALALGQSWRISLTLGIILSLSSTAIVLQTLSEKSLMPTQGGRSAFSVLLMQDIAVIPMLAFLPLLALPGARALAKAQAAESHAALPFLQQLPGWGVTLVTLGAVAAVVLAGHYVIRPLYSFVHRARLREVNTALALMIVVTIATLMLMVGLSPALGAFLAGVVLANSEFKHEIESDIAPFKGLLLGLFFITVGAGIDVDTLLTQPVRIAALALALMVAKGAVLYGLGKLFKLKGRNQWLFTLGLAQAGEFGFVLTAFAVKQRILPNALAGELLLVIALSMFLTPLAFILHDVLAKRMKDEGETHEADEIDEQQPVIIAGVGRFGQVVNRMVTMSGIHTTVLDHDLKVIQLLRKFGFKGYVGDPTRPELLRAAGLAQASVLVVCLDDRDAATRLVAYARRQRDDLHIIVRARDREHVFELYRAGADDIVREYFDGALRIGRYVLENVGLSEYEAREMEKTFFKMDRAAVRELAEVWKPGVPTEKNAEYIARAKELNRELEAALLSRHAKTRAEIAEDEARTDTAAE